MTQTPTVPTRKVIGILYDSAGKPLANEGVVIQFSPSSFVTAGLIQPWTLFPKTDSEGNLEAELFVNELGGIPSFYTIFAPNNDRWTFTVPEGDEPITWSELRARGVINQDWSADLVTEFIRNHPDLRGPPGPPSDGSGGSLVHTHRQLTPAAVWTISNPFGVEPASVTVKDAAGRLVLASIAESSALQVVVDFPSPQSGAAFLVRS